MNSENTKNNIGLIVLGTVLVALFLHFWPVVVDVVEGSSLSPLELAIIDEMNNINFDEFCAERECPERIDKD